VVFAFWVMLPPVEVTVRFPAVIVFRAMPVPLVSVTKRVEV
jgi:hypothetical protein